MSDAYDPELQSMFVATAKKLKLDYKVRQDGCYCMVSGPCYESRTECKFLAGIGGDAVGMSTVPEVIAAKHCGMRILGLSLITNKVVVSKEQTAHANHAEVLEAGRESGKHVEAIVRNLLLDQAVVKYVAALPEVTYVIPPLSGPPPSAGAGTADESKQDQSFALLFLLAAGSVASMMYFASRRHCR